MQKERPSLQMLFDDLFHPNPNINRQACMEMILHWPKESIPRLILNLKEKDIAIRRKSIKALAFFGDAALDPVIENFFATNDLTVQISCLKTLVKIAAFEKYSLLSPSLEKLIYSCLKNEDSQMILVTVCLLRQLGQTGLPILIQASKDKNILLAKAAVTALGEFNELSARNCLRELLENESTDELIKESIVDSLSIYGKD